MREREDGLIGQAWRHIDPAMKILTIGSVSFGVVFTLICIIADINGAWSGLPFLTNLLSTIAVSAFGIPFALVVVASWGSLQSAKISEWKVVQSLP